MLSSLDKITFYRQSNLFQHHLECRKILINDGLSSYVARQSVVFKRQGKQDLVGYTDNSPSTDLHVVSGAVHDTYM